MNKDIKKRIAIFLPVFLIVLVATIIAMPKANINAKIANSSAHISANPIGFYIEKVDEDGNQIDGAELTIKSEWIEGWDGEPGAPFSKDSTETIDIGKAQIKNDATTYVDGIAQDEYFFFSWQSENIVKMTITETEAPTGYEKLSEPIVLEYYYENTSDPDSTIITDPNMAPWDYQYELKIKVISGPSDGYKLIPPSGNDGYTLQIINTTPKYTEKYSYEGDLPDEVMDTLPTRADKYANGSEVIPEDPSNKTVKVGKTTYTFAGWTPASAIIDGADAEFVGRWNATDDPDPVLYDLTVDKTVSGNDGDNEKRFQFTLKLWNDDNTKTINYFAVDDREFYDNNGHYLSGSDDVKNKSYYTKVGSKTFTGATYDNMIKDISEALMPDDPKNAVDQLKRLWTENASPALDLNENTLESAGFGYTDGNANTLSLTPSENEIDVYFIYEFPEGTDSKTIVIQSLRPGRILLFHDPLSLLSNETSSFLQDGVDDNSGTASIDFSSLTDEQLAELKNGASFTMKHSERLKLINIPQGYHYEITEADYSGENYATTVDGMTGITASGALDDTKDHRFVNTKNTDSDDPNNKDDRDDKVDKDDEDGKAPDNVEDPDEKTDPTEKTGPDEEVSDELTVITGDNARILVFAIILLIALVAVVILVYRHRKNK